MRTATPNYPIQLLFLLLFSILLIGQVDASVQIVASNTIQNSSDTEHSTTATGWIDTGNSFNGVINGTGNMRFSLDSYCAGSCIANGYSGQSRVLKNGVVIYTTPAINANSYATYTYNYSGLINTTDTFKTQYTVSGVVASFYIRNFQLMYDYTDRVDISSVQNATWYSLQKTYLGSILYNLTFSISPKTNKSDPYSSIPLNGLVGGWKHDESSGNIEEDFSTTKNNGTANGGYTWVTGMYNKAHYYYGALGDYTNIPTNTIYNMGSGNWTWIVLLKNMNTSQKNKLLIGKDDATLHRQFTLEISGAGSAQPGTFRAVVFSDDSNLLILDGNNTDFANSNWNWVEFGWDTSRSGNSRLYMRVNDVEIPVTYTSIGTYNGTMASTTAPLQFGARSYAGNTNNAQVEMDTALFYNRSLNDSDRKAIIYDSISNITLRTSGNNTWSNTWNNAGNNEIQIPYGNNDTFNQVIFNYPSTVIQNGITITGYTPSFNATINPQVKSILYSYVGYNTTNSTAGLNPISHWKFDEGNGAIAYDSNITSANDAQVISTFQDDTVKAFGTNTFYPMGGFGYSQWISGKIGTGVKTSGRGYIDLGNKSSLSGMVQFHFSAWYIPSSENSSNDYFPIITNYPQYQLSGIYNRSYQIWWYKPTNQYLISLSGVNGTYDGYFNISGNLNSGDWRNVQVDYDGSSIKVWTDNIQSNTTATTTIGALNYTINPTWLLGEMATANPGSIDDVWLFGRSLNDTERTLIFTEPTVTNIYGLYSTGILDAVTYNKTFIYGTYYNAPNNTNFTAVQLSGSGIANIYVNTSQDNISWSGESLLQSNAVTGINYSINSRYVQLKWNYSDIGTNITGYTLTQSGFNAGYISPTVIDTKQTWGVNSTEIKISSASIISNATLYWRQRKSAEYKLTTIQSYSMNKIDNNTYNYSFSNLIDGKYYYYVVVNDTNGNVYAMPLHYVYIDLSLNSINPGYPHLVYQFKNSTTGEYRLQNQSETSADGWNYYETEFYTFDHLASGFSTLYRCFNSSSRTYRDGVTCSLQNETVSTTLGYIFNSSHPALSPLYQYYNGTYYQSIIGYRTPDAGYSNQGLIGYVIDSSGLKEDMVYLNNSRLKVGVNKRFGGGLFYVGDNSRNYIIASGVGNEIQSAFWEPGGYNGNGGASDSSDTIMTSWNPTQIGDVWHIPSKVSNFTVVNNTISFITNARSYNSENGVGSTNIFLNITYTLHQTLPLLTFAETIRNTGTAVVDNHGISGQNYIGAYIQNEFKYVWYNNGSSLKQFNVPNTGKATSIPENVIYISALNSSDYGIGIYNWGRPAASATNATDNVAPAPLEEFSTHAMDIFMMPIQAIPANTTLNNTMFSLYVSNKTEMNNYFTSFEYGIIFNPVTPINQSLYNNNSFIIRVDSTGFAPIAISNLHWINSTGTYIISMPILEGGIYSSINMAGLIGSYNYSYFVETISDSAVKVNTSQVWTNLIDTIPPTSITNNQTTTGNFWINNTWTDPPDADFNYTAFYFSNGTWLQNVSKGIQYLNKSYSSHYIQNLSGQTVDTSGNMNVTKIWFNSTIPNNPIAISNVSSSYSLIEGQQLYIDANYADADSDAGTFATNSTRGTFNTTTGILSWNTVSGDAGTYYWNINVSDGYGSVATANFSVAVSSSTPTAISNLANTTGNFFINWSWYAGSNADDYDVWINGTDLGADLTALFYNGTYSAHAMRTISVRSHNHTLNTYSVWVNQTTTIPNNIPIQSGIGNKNINENQTIAFQINSSDADNDALSYGTNATKGILNSTGYYSWTPTYSDSGTYIWYFNTTDGYGGIATETITLTVNNIPLTLSNFNPSSDPISTAGSQQAFSLNINRTANVTWYFNGTSIQINNSIVSASYTNSSGSIGYWNITAIATDGIDTASHQWNWTVNPIPDTNTTPLISNVVNGSVGDTWGIVNFTVNQSSAITFVKYSQNLNLINSSQTTNQTSGINRSDNITGLLNGTKYYYSVYAFNSSNLSLSSNSSIQNFTTNSNVTIPVTGTPNITKYCNDINGCNQTTMTMNVGNTATFNVTVNQSITSVSWKKDGVEQQNTSSLSWPYNFGAIGTFNITAQAFNANGSSNIVYTVVTIVEGGAPPPCCGGGGTDWDYAYGWVKYPNGTAINSASITTSVGSTTTGSNGYYSFGYIFVHSNNYNFNITKTGFNWSNQTISFATGDYQIVNATIDYISTPSAPLPNITSWSNTNTSNQNLVFTILKNTNITFNITANQSVTTDWTGTASPVKINGTNATDSYAYKNFTSTGTFTVIASCSNSNGTCTNSKTWTITVTSGNKYTLNGYVQNSLESKLENARVDFNNSTNYTVKGYYEFTNISDGNYSLLTRQIGYNNYTSSVSISSDTTLNITLIEKTWATADDVSNAQTIGVVFGLLGGVLAITFVRRRRRMI